MNEQVKELVNKLTMQRENLDSIKIAINKLPKSRGTALAFTALEKGRMYIGEVCRDLGKAYPYEATKKAEDAKGIQEAVDLGEDSIELSDNEIVNLNALREYLEDELNVFLDTVSTIDTKGFKGITNFVLNSNVSEAYRGLKESRMYLDIRLGEIRDNANIISNVSVTAPNSFVGGSQNKLSK